MDHMRLNLARSWRSKTFDGVVGQDLAVRILKNSLYLNRFFPVYLFSGQRGCGKTTLARIFAAALNCTQREQFTKDPQSTKLPCLECTSCRALHTGSHPDFCEIDAASHTGVDNVRTLIESASFMPGLGTKKVYLIDEAHMLSRAAFNAFLKILEEPPMSVVFMLATTDPHKILETVRSRCFQIFLSPVSTPILENYLLQICQKESVEHEPQALAYIARVSQGSVRDAINMLEQAMLAHQTVSYKSVVESYGDVTMHDMLNICQAVLKQNHELLNHSLKQLNAKSEGFISAFKTMIELLNGLLWLSYGLESHINVLCGQNATECARELGSEKLLAILDQWYKAEPLFIKTTAKRELFEFLCIRMTQISSITETKFNLKTVRSFSAQQPNSGIRVDQYMQQQKTQEAVSIIKTPEQTVSDKTQKTITELVKNDTEHSDHNSDHTIDTRWSEFLKLLTQTHDQLAVSIFGQAIFDQTCIFQDNNLKKIHIIFDESQSFFKELLDQSKSAWEPLIKNVFGHDFVLVPLFDKRTRMKSNQVSNHTLTQQNNAKQNIIETSARTYDTGLSAHPEHIEHVDVSNAEHWPKIHSVLEVFPGKISFE